MRTSCASPDSEDFAVIVSLYFHNFSRAIPLTKQGLNQAYTHRAHGSRTKSQTRVLSESLLRCLRTAATIKNCCSYTFIPPTHMYK